MTGERLGSLVFSDERCQPSCAGKHVSSIGVINVSQRARFVVLGSRVGASSCPSRVSTAPQRAAAIAQWKRLPPKIAKGERVHGFEGTCKVKDQHLGAFFSVMKEGRLVLPTRKDLLGELAFPNVLATHKQRCERALES